MARDYGNGVSRTLPVQARQFLNVIYQKGKPPLDAEFNLQDDIAAEQLANAIRASMPSGFVQDPTASRRDFVVDPAWSNFFKFGRAANGDTAPLLWANVNGWVVPIVGTAVDEGDPSNRVDMWPPPASDNRIDLVFLEVWLAQVAPNPSEVHKPSASTLWKWGNVLYGGTNLADDIQDPTIGTETTERTQLQYRIRVVGQGSGLGSSVALDDFPDGLDDPNVVGQGAASSPVSGMTYTNMGATLGDAGLWRAGNGNPTNDLDTVDGYTYAIPICAVFRRNTNPFIARTSSGNPNQNGALDRNPSSVAITDPAEGTRVFGTVTLTNAISDTTTGIVQVNDLTNSGLDNPDIDWDSTFLMLDGEIISISAVNTAVSPGTITIRATGGRGRWGTMAAPHAAGTTLQFFNSRHDGLFADEIATVDILDMRRSVTLGDWDHSRLLLHNLSRLFQGELKTSYKQGGIGDTQGVTVVEVDTLDARGSVAVPNQTEALDGPDGIRTIFSDSASLQPDVTMLLGDPDVLAGGSPGFVAAYDSGQVWDVGADFVPGGFVVGGDGWRNGDIIFCYIGGADGTAGARGTFRDGSERAVRFVSPREYWVSRDDPDVTGQQTPVTIRFLTQGATEPAGPGETAADHPGPMYPLKEQNFEKPFTVLGGLLNSLSQVTGTVEVVPETAPSAADWEVVLPGLDFDTAGSWFSQTGGQFDNDPDAITNPVLHGTKTLFGMLTDNGRDRTGASSEVYLVLWGDTTDGPLVNNGVFRVVGAGTAGYTTKDATAPDRLRVEFVSQGVSDFVASTGMNAELRSQYMHSADDSGGSAGGQAAMCIVFTDIAGVAGSTSNPWNGLITQPVQSQAVVRTTLMYHPGRGGTARVADQIYRFAVVSAGAEYLRQSPTTRDTSFPGAAGVPDDETYFDVNHIQTWNRLSGLGLNAPDAPAYGGEVVSSAEQDREAEVFADSGSKTVMFRPYLSRSMTLQRRTAAATLFPATYLLGHSVDGAGIFPVARDQGYAVPPEFMPRFGRHDIPFYVDVAGTGAGTFLQGLNHMFVDTLDATDPQFNIAGGRDTGIGGGVNSILFQTTATVTSGLDYGEYGAIPPGSLGDAYQCRLYTNSNVVSSDLGRVLRGIQLPPFLGIARIYGIYERTDWDAAGGGSMFGSNRITPIGGTAPNLLRTDAKKQTLFIVQGGAEDVTGNANDHTYVIPEDLIDITLSDTYTDGTDFEDYEYIVECIVFGFARGFINENNYVLARRNNGAGGGGTVVTLTGAEMVFPAPAPVNDQAIIEYNRTPYQGDPYMSRAGSTRTVSDYEHRYGQIDQSDAFELARPIQQFDSAGDTIPETPNVRALQVLASVDFWTTLGTGKVGGRLFAGTVTDAGHIKNDALTAGRVPAESTDPPFQVDVRTFTEGQKNNPVKAMLRLSILSNAAIGAADGFVFRGPFGSVSILAGADFVVGGTAESTALNIADAINAEAILAGYVKALPTGSTAHITLVSVVGGAAAGDILVSTNDPIAFSIDAFLPESSVGGVTTQMGLQGGVDIPVNSGNGSSSLALTGLTERLPLGILVQDSDFLCEDLFRDGTGQLVSFMGGLGISPVVTPLAAGSEEYTRLVGGPGAYIGQADGGILRYAPFDENLSPTGSRKFRLFRGGGSAFVLSDPRPGGPVDWTAGSLPQGLQPILKGGVLVGKAMLVRNFPETAFSGSERTSYGDELQMVVVTRAIFGDGSEAEEGLSLTGQISPTGYGEGYAAADRYRIEGLPMALNQGGAPPDTDVDLAVFPFSDLTSNVG